MKAVLVRSPAGIAYASNVLIGRVKRNAKKVRGGRNGPAHRAPRETFAARIDGGPLKVLLGAATQ